MMRHHPEEFIGRKVKVIQGRNKSLEGIQGRIIDETKNSFKIRTNKEEEKSVMKQGTVFMIDNHEITGKNIVFKIEERIKLKKGYGNKL